MGEIRQSYRNPTSTEEDSTICSSRHKMKLGKVGEPIIFKEKFVNLFRSPIEVKLLHYSSWSAI